MSNSSSALHPAGVHLQLWEVAVDMDLVSDFPIRVTESVMQVGEPIGVVKRRAR